MSELELKREMVEALEHHNYKLAESLCKDLKKSNKIKKCKMYVDNVSDII